jgi:hypothetical protein
MNRISAWCHGLAGATVGCFLPLAAGAHVPFVEEQDYSRDQPYVVEDVTNSKAISAALASADDVDFYRITINEPTRLFVTSNVPFCSQYREFGVSMALAGPGLPAPAARLPVALKEGHGAIVIRDIVTEPDQRPVFFEPFSGRQSWEGPEYALDEASPGTYEIIVWNEQGRTGDYMAVIGEAERFGPAEIRQVRAASPKLTGGRNLMVDCDPTGAPDDPRRRSTPPRIMGDRQDH